MGKKEIIKSTQVPMEDWKSIEEHEIRLLRTMSIHDGIQQYQEMQTAFEWQMQQTADLFALSHRQALIELQARLQRLASRQSSHG